MTVQTKKQVLDLLNKLKEAGIKGKALKQFEDLDRLLRDECSSIAGGIMPKLIRPCCVLDLETTGVNVDLDFIVEITILRIDTDLSEEKKTMLLNPGVPIPDEARLIHGITDEMVKDAPTFVQVSKGILKFIEGCDIITFNGNRFDVPLLSSMFLRSGLKWDWKKVHLIDVSNIFRIHEKRTLTDAVAFYLNREHSEAHSAEADVAATKAIFVRQLLKYNLPVQMDKLASYCMDGKEILDFDRKFELNDKGFVVFAFGKHKGKIAKYEKSYLSWMVNTGEFTRDTKAFAQQQLDIPLK